MSNLPIPSVPDGYDGDPVIDAAWRALAAFGDELDRPTAALLLPIWRHASELTDRGSA